MMPAGTATTTHISRLSDVPPRATHRLVAMTIPTMIPAMMQSAYARSGKPKTYQMPVGGLGMKSGTSACITAPSSPIGPAGRAASHRMLAPLARPGRRRRGWTAGFGRIRLTGRASDGSGTSASLRGGRDELVQLVDGEVRDVDRLVLDEHRRRARDAGLVGGGVDGAHPIGVLALIHTGRETRRRLSAGHLVRQAVQLRRTPLQRVIGEEPGVVPLSEARLGRTGHGIR